LPTKNSYKLFQLVTGAYGDLTSDIGYEFTAQYGKNKVTQQQLDNVTANFIQSMDAVDDGNGNIVCADTSNGCAPLNPFGVNAASDEARAFVMIPTAIHGELEQTVLNYSINGDLTELPAGAVLFASGLEYRSEKSTSTPDDILLPGGLTHTSYAGGKEGVTGDYNVAEVFAEVLIPLISDAPLVEELNLEAAVRYSDYSTVGGQTSYKLRLNWTITDEVRLRSSHGLAIRAPNVGELYQAASTKLMRVQDPCSSSYIGQGSANRAANCASLGIPEGWTAYTEAGEIPIKISGNEALRVEESTSSTYGLVYTPQWIKGFSIAVDYWDIGIDDAISSPNRNEILANCVDFDMTDNTFCALFDRNTDDHEISQVRNQKVNVAALTAKGYDLEINYQLDLQSAGTVLFNLVGSYYDQREQLLNAQKPDDILQGVNIYNNPKTRGYFSATYNLDRWNAHLAFNYLGSSQISEITTDARVYPVNHIDSVVYVNFRGAYRFDDNIKVFAGINNLMNKGPQKDRPSMTTGSTIYDAIGRSFYLGVNYEY
ncbi:MAG: TonB-dependent receptor, partial [Psychrosphaera sp.]|nr:TonB-dependent receptor [Psychrosphaera sp.]